MFTALRCGLSLLAAFVSAGLIASRITGNENTFYAVAHLLFVILIPLFGYLQDAVFKKDTKTKLWALGLYWERRWPAEMSSGTWMRERQFVEAIRKACNAAFARAGIPDNAISSS
jgi:hypothetical protein